MSASYESVLGLTPFLDAHGHEVLFASDVRERLAAGRDWADLLAQIATAPDVEHLTDLWAAHKAEWTPIHTAAAAARKQALAGAA